MGKCEIFKRSKHFTPPRWHSYTCTCMVYTCSVRVTYTIISDSTVHKSIGSLWHVEIKL